MPRGKQGPGSNLEHVPSLLRAGNRVPRASGLERPVPLLTSCLSLTFTGFFAGSPSVSVQLLLAILRGYYHV